jgi:hypothetical protein
MRRRMWLLGALHLATGCNMYDGALLFMRQQPLAAGVKGDPDAGTAAVVVSVSDAGQVQMLAVDGGRGESGDGVDEVGGPPRFGRGGGGGWGGGGDRVRARLREVVVGLPVLRAFPALRVLLAHRQSLVVPSLALGFGLTMGTATFRSSSRKVGT